MGVKALVCQSVYVTFYKKHKGTVAICKRIIYREKDARICTVCARAHAHSLP